MEDSRRNRPRRWRCGPECKARVQTQRRAQTHLLANADQMQPSKRFNARCRCCWRWCWLCCYLLLLNQGWALACEAVILLPGSSVSSLATRSLASLLTDDHTALGKLTGSRRQAE